MAVKETLTGNRRMRLQKSFLRKPVLVLQVEVRRKGNEYEYPGVLRDVDCTYFRDATVEDLTEGTPA